MWQIRDEIYLHAVVNKKKHWGLPACFRQNKSSTFINVSIVILLLFCKKKDINNDNNNYPKTAVLIHLL